AEAGLWLLHDLLHDYALLKPTLPPAWFDPPREELLGRSKEELDELERQRTWVELLVGIEVRVAFNATLGRLPELAGIAAETMRHTGEEAARRGDRPALDFSI